MGGPLPGWYPDPSGARGRRYWDGRQWTVVESALPPPPPPPRPTNWKLIGGIGAAVVVLLIAVGALSNNDDETNTTAETSFEPTPWAKCGIEPGTRPGVQS